MEERLLEIINYLLENNDKDKLGELDKTLSLRDDLEFDSFDLAELAVRLEDEFNVDVFESGIVHTIEDVVNRLNQGERK